MDLKPFWEGVLLGVCLGAGAAAIGGLTYIIVVYAPRG